MFSSVHTLRDWYLPLFSARMRRRKLSHYYVGVVVYTPLWFVTRPTSNHLSSGPLLSLSWRRSWMSSYNPRIVQSRQYGRAQLFAHAVPCGR